MARRQESSAVGSPSNDLPAADCLTVDRDYELIGQVHRRTAVIGHDAQHRPERRQHRRLGPFNGRVVLGQGAHARVRIAAQPSVPACPSRAISTKHLATSIEHQLARSTADNGTDCGKSDVGRRTAAEIELLSVVEHVDPWPHLGNRPSAGEGGCGSRTSAEYLALHSGSSERRRRQAERPSFVRDGALGRARAVAVAGVGEHAPHQQTGASGRHRQIARNLGNHPGPVMTTVDLDKHFEVGPPGSVASQCLSSLGRIDPDSKRATLAERSQPRAAGTVYPQWVGDEHAVAAGFGEDLSLGDGRDRDTDGACLELAGGDLTALVGLDVRSEGHSPITCHCRHRLQVPAEHVEIDGKVRRRSGKRLVGHVTSFHGPIGQ